MAKMFSVISTSHCAPDSVKLQINTEKRTTYNINGGVVFFIKDTSSSLHKRRVLCDDQGNPIVTLYKKVMTSQGRSQVFVGKSNELLFSVKFIKKRPKIPAGITILNVFLANNMDESSCDFRVVIVGNKMSCTVYAGESPTVVATMENNGGFDVSVNPNVDNAFIVALLMIVNEMGGLDFNPNPLPIAAVQSVVSIVFSIFN